MSCKSHICDTCAKACEDAKLLIIKLNKRILVLSIVCTAAITLLGQQGGKALIESLNTVNTAMTAADPKHPKTESEEKKEQTKPEIKNIHAKGAWKPYQFSKKEYPEDKFIKPYELVDELSSNNQNQEIKNNVISVLSIDTTDPLSLTNNNTNFTQTFELRSNAYIPHFSDNFSVFFTPSLLPFDVYSTTLALGNNYGFGEYYGIDNGYFISTPTPGPVVLTGFAMLMFASTRQRN